MPQTLTQPAPHICGTADDRERPSTRHYAWHLRNGTEPCGKSRCESSWYQAERKAGRSLPDWEPSVPHDHACGTADDQERPSGAHYQFHLRAGTEPCEKAHAELNWYFAEKSAGRPVPDYQYKNGWRASRKEYECGTEEDRESPSGAHYGWHKFYNTEPCGKSRAEKAWYRAEKEAGHPLPDYQYKTGWNKERTRKVEYECGTSDDRTQPSKNHYAWHKFRNTEPCGKALAENAWYRAEKSAGCSLPDWQPFDFYDHQCGTADDRKQPSTAHYKKHYREGTEPCGKGLAERNWWMAEWKVGQALPDWEPGHEIDWDAPTCLYRYDFADGDIYWGITSQQPEDRWNQESRDLTRLGRKLRKQGIGYEVKVVALCDNRWIAVEMEERAIKASNGHALLNDTHNPDRPR